MRGLFIQQIIKQRLQHAKCAGDKLSLLRKHLTIKWGRQDDKQFHLVKFHKRHAMN